ncbi:EboA domain-containing protein [Verrucomicrobiales bacterium]|nr:EboA domain-containing protein [Verrucomicrobiales bacterium]MDC0276046.1 EboA domain-containing protein [Verrucomicrobiales bacterium]
MLDSLLKILKNSASPEACGWLDETLAAQREKFEQRPFYYAFSGVSRHFDKKALIEVSEDELKALDLEKPGFTVSNWDEFRLARVILLLVLGEQEAPVFLENVNALLNTADIREQVAIFSALPLLPEADELVPMAQDGLRSNITEIYDSIALDNPFPSEHFSNDAWNQMVLKSFFINRPLYRFYGVDYRANLVLAEALSNFAHERWAAGRWVSPELWRSCANFVSNPQIAEDLEQVAGTDEAGQLEAVALIVAKDESGALDHLRDVTKTFLDDVADGRLTWRTLGEQI